MAFQETFKALSDPVRRDILEMLKNGKLSAGEIVQKFEMTGATISYHLSILKKAELVTKEAVFSTLEKMHATIQDSLKMIEALETDVVGQLYEETEKTKIPMIVSITITWILICKLIFR